MKYLVAYTERRANAKRHIVVKRFGETHYFNSIDEATSYAHKFDLKKFKVEILTENHELVKEM